MFIFELSRANREQKKLNESGNLVLELNSHVHKLFDKNKCIMHEIGSDKIFFIVNKCDNV